VLCPGQGAQHIGMGKSWCDRYEAAQQTFDQADDALGYKLSEVCFQGPGDRLNRTDIAQEAIYVTSVACYRALAQSQNISPVQAAAGLSLGEFTALHLAGAFDFVTGLNLVSLRGQAMQDAADAVPGGSGMVALVGADEEQARELCDRARGDDVLVPANFNCPGQVVISGSANACQRAITVAQAMSLRATPLKVAGAFHSPLMQPAADRLSKALDQVQWATPTATVLSNVTAKPHDPQDTDAIKQHLVEQLTNPVRWADSITWALSHLTGQFIELAPGKALTGMMRRIDRQTKVQSFSEPTDD